MYVTIVKRNVYFEFKLDGIYMVSFINFCPNVGGKIMVIPY